MAKLPYRPCGIDIHTQEDLIKELRKHPSKDFGNCPGFCDSRKFIHGTWGENSLNFDDFNARVEQLLNNDMGYPFDVSESERISEHFSLRYLVRSKVRRVLNSIPVAVKEEFIPEPDEWITEGFNYFMPKTNLKLFGEFNDGTLMLSLTRYVNPSLKENGYADAYYSVEKDREKWNLGMPNWNEPTRDKIAKMLGII